MAEEKPEVLDAVLKETVNLENIPIEEVLENLRCSKEGLSSEAAEERLAIFGHNKLEEKQGKPPDWQDFAVIITLLVIKSTISFIKENNAGNATAALMAHLAPKAKTNTRVASFVGTSPLTQISLIFFDMLNVYRMYSELVSSTIAEGGPFASKTSYVKYCSHCGCLHPNLVYRSPLVHL